MASGGEGLNRGPDRAGGPDAGVGADGGGGRQTADEWPAVSVIVPVQDEAYARAVVEGLLADPYPGEFEILLAAPPAGGRPDGDDPLASIASDPRVAVVHAKSSSKAALVNAAAFAARYAILSRVRRGGGNWVELLKRAVAAMEVTGADVVGGTWVAFGLGSAEQAISRALNSSLGVGPRPSRAGVGKGPVDSVRMVAIRRDAYERAGGLVEAFAGAQDWELQLRVRRAGGMVWLDPSLALRGRTPASAGELAKLMFRAGAWRRRVIAAHANTSTPRYLVPPALVVVLFLALAGAGAGGLLVSPGWWWLALTPAAYGLAMALGVAATAPGLRVGGKIRMWWAVMVIHLSWGAGFLVGRGRRRQGRARTAAPS
ncbi:MAG: hypothetical protein LBD70_00085 [Bifidobacteriaceae bacterium]|nr:hypothetical protein [Bifidobacteriaceae bacterium]